MTTVLAVSISSHEMWRDELQAWAIARSAGDPLEVVDALAWERHPPLWHLLLWGLSRFVRDPAALQWVGFAIGAATAWVLIHHAPFGLPVRLALAAGYYPLYELGTISRSWSLVGLLSLLILVERSRVRPRCWILGALLVLLSLTEVHGAILAAGFVGAELVRDGRWRRLHRLHVLALGVAVIAATAVMFLLIRAPDGGDSDRLRGPFEYEFFRRLTAVRDATVRALFPIPEFRVGFWGWFAVDRIGPLVYLLAAAALAIVTSVAARSREVLAFWLVVVGGMSAATALVGIPVSVPRHASVFAIAVLAVFWMSATATAPTAPLRRWVPETRFPRTRLSSSAASWLAGVALGCGLVASVWAVSTEIDNPFSSSEQAAVYVAERAAGQPTAVLCWTSVAYCSSVSIRLDTTMHRSGDDPGASFVVFDRNWMRGVPVGTTQDRQSIGDAAQQLADRLGAVVAVVYRVGPDSTAPPCSRAWTPDQATISGESVGVCMASDLLPPEGADSDGST